MVISPTDLFSSIVTYWTTNLDTGKREEKQERILTPGIIQGDDRDFVEGYATGRDCYFAETYHPVWPDGSEVHSIASLEEARTICSEKYRDLSVHLVRQYIRDAMADDPLLDASPSYKGGFPLLT